MISYMAYRRVRLLGVILVFTFASLLSTLGAELLKYSEYLDLKDGALWWVLVIVYIVVLLVLVLNGILIGFAAYVFFFSGFWAMLRGGREGVTLARFVKAFDAEGAKIDGK